MRGNLDELDSAVDDGRRCKNSPILSYLREQKKHVDRGREVGQFTAG